MTRHGAGFYDVTVAISGDGPYTARGFVRPRKSGQVLESVDVWGEFETAPEAEAAAIEKAKAVAYRMPYDRRHVD